MNDPRTKSQRKRRAGRPRSFDRETVLAQAMVAFWKHGYEGTSIPNLTAAMGITPQSLYTAFGSKAALYREALEHYAHGVGDYATRTLTEEADVFAAFGQMLRQAATLFSDKDSPRGCMVSLEMLSHSPEGATAAVHAKELRRAGIDRVRSRLQRAVQDKQLPRGTDVGKWARFLYAAVQGMAIQARDGASRRELLGIGEVAIQSLRSLDRSQRPGQDRKAT